MENLINVSREVYDFPFEVNLPKECCEKIFIPSFSVECQHYYFLVDFAEHKITCWSINLKQIEEDLKARIEQADKEVVPWNQELDRFLSAIYFAHSAKYYDGKIYVSFIDGNFILCLNVDDDNYELIYDKENEGLNKIYSSTNMLYDDEIYFSRWRIEESFQHVKNYDIPVNLEIGKYSLITKKFEVFDTFEGPDDIHTTFITKDKENLIIVEMTQDPNIRYPKPGEEYTDEEMVKILNGGLRNSDLITYNFKSGKYHKLSIPNGPAHIEFDLDDDNIYYLSSHNLSTNNDKLCAYGTSRIDKVKVEDGKSIVIDSYEGEDFYRIPSHKLLKYNGKKLIVCPVFPNRIHIVDADTMQIYKKIQIGKTKASVDFSKGPFDYPASMKDKTPYTIYPVQGTSYLYLISLWNVTIYDFENETKVATVGYNLDKPLIAMGHASKY